MYSNDNDNKDSIESKQTKKEKRVLFLLACLCSICIWFFGTRPFIVNGLSMYPNFNLREESGLSSLFGDYLFIDVASYLLREPERFDVVVFTSSKQTGNYLLKRVIGLPNETIIFNENTISITDRNGETIILEEPYLKDDETVLYEDTTIKLGDEEYYLLGDNRNNSFDSRFFGPVPKNKFIGRAALRIYPLGQTKVLPGDIKNIDR